jgi:hypothetical protein
VPIGDPVARRRPARGRGELRLGDEQLVLEPDDQIGEIRPGRGKLGRSAAQVSPQLVERAERREPRRVLRYAGTANEAGFAAVAAAGV